MYVLQRSTPCRALLYTGKSERASLMANAILSVHTLPLNPAAGETSDSANQPQPPLGRLVHHNQWKCTKGMRSACVLTQWDSTQHAGSCTLCQISSGSNPNERRDPGVRDNAVCIWGNCLETLGSCKYQRGANPGHQGMETSSSLSCTQSLPRAPHRTADSPRAPWLISPCPCDSQGPAKVLQYQSGVQEHALLLMRYPSSQATTTTLQAPLFTQEEIKQRSTKCNLGITSPWPKEADPQALGLHPIN